MMRIFLTVVVAGIVLAATPAMAEFKGCYERVYDKSYLRKNKKQLVTKMRIQIGVGKGFDGPFELLDRIDAGFRKAPIYRGGLVECTAKGDELECAIEGDGGSFVVTDRGNNSIRITNLDSLRFGESTPEIFAKKGNKEFRLFRISKTACP